jgi:protein O-GlcNAc transferase
MLFRLLAQITARITAPRHREVPGTNSDGSVHTAKASPPPDPLADGPSPAEWHRRASSLLDSGDIESAAASYLAGISQHPDNAALRINASNLLKTLHRVAEARQHLERAVQLSPDLAGAWYNLGILLQETWWLEEALDAFKRAFELEKRNGPSELLGAIARSIGLVLQRNGRWLQAREFLADTAKEFPPLASDCERIALFTWVEDSISSPGEKLNAYVNWAGKYADHLLPEPGLHVNAAIPERPLRVGYVSGDFREHAVSYFFEPLLQHHDPARYLVHCYDNTDVSDATSIRLKSLPARWRPVSKLSDSELIRAIKDDEIDILIDLSGHTARNRLDVFACKPAPLQATWLGFRLTTGMAAIDYRISDCYVDPPGVSESWHRERLLRLPGSQWCYSAPRDSPALSPLPMLSKHHVTFGSFNQVDKLTDNVLSAWAQIMHSLPGSRLTMVGIPMGRYRDALLSKWREMGIDSSRLSLYSHVKREQFLAIHHDVDVALDPFPYNGGTTTCETLWMGVPVLTLAGTSSLARAGVSLLSAAAMPDWIADSREDYIRLAVAKVSDPKALSMLRARMREHLLASTLMDGARFTLNFEAALRGAWREWCAQQSPGA